MKFKDRLFFLFSYTNATDIKEKYPNFINIILLNIFGVLFYFIIPTFLAKMIYVIILIGANLCFKETRGLVISCLPIIIWCLLFTMAKDIPLNWRRNIDVDTLYNLEKYFGSISFKFYKDPNVFLDLLAWIPYGIIHYLMPFFVGFYLVFYHKPGYTSAYLFFFGIMNSLGVLTQLIWPTAPLWYYKKYNTAPANYTMHGDPAGLGRIDELFHIDFYDTTFTGNPLPWGAWPSLHSGFACYSATFLIYLYPKCTPFFILYVLWIWWATMYLGHHYFVDLIGGLVYAVIPALCGIFYLRYTKPYHKDFIELRSIVVEEYDNNLITNEYPGNNKRGSVKKVPVEDDMEDNDRRNMDGNSTVVNGGTTNNHDDGVSSSSDDRNKGLSPADININRLSVIPNIDESNGKSMM